ncbi:MAG TPA: coniferyl aldehyde dehydrogenase [Polyangiaceae bacterium]|nr:coniferyl aldehyde dehydrogenase [Polyangiaceae bacterium]
MAEPAAQIPFDSTPSLVTRRLEELLGRTRKAAESAGTPDLHVRLERLDRLATAIADHEQEAVDALAADFGHRSRDASRYTDVAAVLEGIQFARKNLRRWMKPERRSPQFPLGLLGATARVEFQPLGVVGIVSPWNFPLYLAFSPLVGVLAAGNRAMLKPSEIAPRSADVIAKIVRSAFDETVVSVVTGGPEVGEAFCHLPFDHLVFTGGGAIAKHVMRAAAEHLVPVTLELGGKCPVVIGRDANLAEAAGKIMAGKCLNAGQICLAPDYVFVPEARRGELVVELRRAVEGMFDGLRENPDYTSVVNARHYERLSALREDARKRGAEIVEVNPKNERFSPADTHKMPPTLVLGATDEMRIMQEEIFGPLLPIQTYRNIDDVIQYVNAHDRPLALYYLGPDERESQAVVSRTTSGGVTVNDVLMHIAQEDLPFGGVGPSGMGAYHGREGFRTFSHAKAIYRQAKVDFLGKLLRPPYGDRYRKLVRMMIDRARP